MNLSQFFEHWSIAENPFRGEEARHDEVFARLVSAGQASGTGRPATVHSDFEKILGELGRPSSAIVFGEKGSGKTAIRLQIAREIEQYNAAHPDARVLLAPYDDLNRFLDCFHDRVGGASPLESFESMRLVDHLDAILSIAVTRLVSDLLGEPGAAGAIGPEYRRVVRRLDRGLKQDLMLLQSVYDAGPHAAERTRRLGRLVRPGVAASRRVWSLLAYCGWVLPAGVVALYFTLGGGDGSTAWTAGFAGATAIWAVGLVKRFVWDRLVAGRLARRLARQLRMLDRAESSRAASLERLDPAVRSAGLLPVTDSDEPRYAMIGLLRRVLAGLGVTGLIVVVDRIDEPTLVSGDPDRMRAIIWPLLNNKFLQQEGIGIKMLLPIDLRYALFRESSAFFQEARLDKQSLIERLSWTGPMLYDLCNARLSACRSEGAEPISLLDLFAEDVSRQDVVDALDQMHQPRDAFKLLYRCLTDHCSHVTADEQAWRIPRLVLETVRRAEVERLQQLYRGIRPA